MSTVAPLSVFLNEKMTTPAGVVLPYKSLVGNVDGAAQWW